MSSSQALRYLVLSRWRNRLRSWLGRLKTPTGLLGLVLLLLVGLGLVMGGDFGRASSLTERKVLLTSLLGFLLLMGVLSGIGQRGLVFTRADLDFLFPAPVPKRQLLLYYFIPHYVTAALMAFMYLLFLGGRHMPSPPRLYVGVVLCLVTNVHLSALAAELSMMLADRLHARLRRVTVPLVILLALGSLAVVLAGINGWGGTPGWLRDIWTSGPVRAVFYPAVQAVELGAAQDAANALVALAALLGCVVITFLPVLLLRVDVLEGSFGATRKVRGRMEQARRGVVGTRVKASSRGPRGGLWRGAGAVLWLNVLTMRRQVRAVLGGLIVVLVMLGVFAGRSGGSEKGQMLLIVLGMITLWMPLPVGFRLPRDQLLALQQLPLRPRRLAAALLTVPVLVPALLQTLAVVAMTVVGLVPWELALAVVPAYVLMNGSTVGIDSLFVLRREHPNQVNLVHEIGKIMLQVAALLPAVATLATVLLSTQNRPAAVLAATLVQGAVACAIVAWLGSRLRRGAIRGA